MNTFGTRLRVTTFGESHGPAIGGVIDGFPSGFKIDFEELQRDIDKRSPGSSILVTQRKEKDKPEFLSGINAEGITLGTPIGFIIRNSDSHSKDYSSLENKYRPNHADFTYEAKYGLRDHRGGGRSSARETANWVVAGALALQWLQEREISIDTAITAVGEVSFTEEIKRNLMLHPSVFNGLKLPEDINFQFEEEILKAKNDNDSVGGVVSCIITGLPAGIGDPVFSKLHSRLAEAMMSINAAKGFEYGLGFEAAQKNGSEVLDLFGWDEDSGAYTETNFSGGIQGGITNGMPVFFNIAFKPTPTIFRELPTITKTGEHTVLEMRGRHDPCVAVRAVPIVRSLAALVIADFLI